MPALFSLGQHPALVEVAGQLRPDEVVFAFLDDVYAVCKPDRVVEVFTLLRGSSVKTQIVGPIVTNAA